MKRTTLQPTLLLLTLLPCPLLAANTIYYEQEPGSPPSFSDQPKPGAKPVELNPLNTVPAISPTVRKPRVSEPETESEPSAAYSITLTAPADGATITNIIAPVPVTLTVTPALQKGHTINLWVDDSLYASNQSGAFSVSGLSRGQIESVV